MPAYAMGKQHISGNSSHQSLGQASIDHKKMA
jgi:hypothetical protein